METYRRRGNTVKGNQGWKGTEEETRELREDGGKNLKPAILRTN